MLSFIFKLKFMGLKSRKIAMRAFVGSLCVIMWRALPAFSQSQKTSNDWWNQIKQSDAHIRSCRVTWKRVMTTKSHMRSDVEKQVQRAKEQVRQEGGTAADIEQTEQNVRTLIHRQIIGYTQTQVLSFVRVGRTIRCDVLSGAPSDTTSSPNSVIAHYIDFYDGKNAVNLAGRGTAVPTRGQVTRDNKEILAHSAPALSDLLFLSGTAITSEFSPTNSTLHEGPNNTLILERHLKTPHLYRLRLALDKAHLRPIAFEGVDESFAPDNVVKMRRIATDYRAYSDGIWFPSKIKTDRGFGGEEDVLVKVDFNEMVDPMETRLPPGTKLADTRFGDKKTVGYKLKNGQLLTDEEVTNLIQQKQKAKRAADKAEPIASQHMSTLPVTPAFGLLFIFLGSVLWIRTQPKNGDPI